MSEQMKLYYYGTYLYRGMKRPKKFITYIKDNIPCTALSPIKTIYAHGKIDAIERIKIQDAIIKASNKVFN